MGAQAAILGAALCAYVLAALFAERRQAEARQDLLIAELGHRVKNVLAKARSRRERRTVPGYVRECRGGSYTRIGLPSVRRCTPVSTLTAVLSVFDTSRCAALVASAHARAVAAMKPIRASRMARCIGSLVPFQFISCVAIYAGSTFPALGGRPNAQGIEPAFSYAASAS